MTPPDTGLLPIPPVPRSLIRALAMTLLCFLAACASPAQRMDRHGEEIIICGQMFRIGTPVVLWTDPGGYDAYRTDKRFAPPDQTAWKPDAGPATPNRYADRRAAADPALDQRVRDQGWTLDNLRAQVDQFVIHYDASGTSRACFRTLHDTRGLSVHFMIDLDGTIYQTLDLKERAWHATIANDRSIGVEIANIGAYPPTSRAPLDRWYGRDAVGTLVTLPPDVGGGGVRLPGPYRPARDELVIGEIQNQTLAMYDLTRPQYDALIKLTAALCTLFPAITCDYPRDDRARLITTALAPDIFASYHGLLGHYHIQQNKTDPGPAFDWDRVINGAKHRIRGW